MSQAVSLQVVALGSPLGTAVRCQKPIPLLPRGLSGAKGRKKLGYVGIVQQ